MDLYGNEAAEGTGFFRRTICLGYRSVFQDGQISPSLLWEEIEESAEQHCRLIGLDVFTLLKREEAWVLKSGASRMFRYPGYGERIQIITWISSMDRFRGYREFRVMDEGGAILGEMSTLWVFMDLEKRALKAIPREFRNGWGAMGNPLHSHFQRKTNYPSLEGGMSRIVSIRRRDLDSSSHVHNIRYLEWLSETVSDEVYRDCQIADFSVLHRSEMRSGGLVEIRTQDLGGNCYGHEYYNQEEETLLCSASSRWVRKVQVQGRLQSVI